MTILLSKLLSCLRWAWRFLFGPPCYSGWHSDWIGGDCFRDHVSGRYMVSRADAGFVLMLNGRSVMASNSRDACIRYAEDHAVGMAYTTGDDVPVLDGVANDH